LTRSAQRFADWIEWRMKRSLVAAQAMPASYEALCES